MLDAAKGYYAAIAQLISGLPPFICIAALTCDGAGTQLEKILGCCVEFCHVFLQF